MKHLTNFRALTVRYLGPTMTKGSRVKITDDRLGDADFAPKSVTLDYDPAFNCARDAAQAYLEGLGIALAGSAEMPETDILLTRNFDTMLNGKSYRAAWKTHFEAQTA